RQTRGLRRWVTRLITPPLPAASRPSKITTSFSFLKTTQSMSLISSRCRRKSTSSISSSEDDRLADLLSETERLQTHDTLPRHLYFKERAAKQNLNDADDACQSIKPGEGAVITEMGCLFRTSSYRVSLPDLEHCTAHGVRKLVLTRRANDRCQHRHAQGIR